MEKAKKKTIVILIIVLSVILAVTGYIVLPDTLTMQVTLSGQSGNTMPKPLGLAIPLLICITSSILYYKNDEKQKYLFVSLVGILIYALTFIFNL